MVSMRADDPYQPNERDPLGILLYVTQLHTSTFVSPVHLEQGSFGTRVCAYPSAIRILPCPLIYYSQVAISLLYMGYFTWLAYQRAYAPPLVLSATR